MNDQEHASLSIIKRAATRRQQSLAGAETAEREDAKWQNRLKRAARFTVISMVIAPVLLFGFAPFWLYPRDPEGLGIFLGVSVVLAVFFSAAIHVQEWLDASEERHLFWRTFSVLLFLATAGGMLYTMYVTADYWRPHIY